MGMEDLRALQKALDAQERKTGSSGAVPLMPKQRMLDISELNARHPDKRIRWCNLRDPNKVASRRASGYVRLTSEDGGIALGDEMATFALPRSEYDNRVKAVEFENKRRLTAHEDEVASVVEGVARLLRDKYGLKIDEKRLLIND